MTRMERSIGAVLLVGVVASAFVVLFGGAVFVWRHGSVPVHYRIFRGEASDLRTLEGILGDLKAFSGRGIIQLGLMLLVAVQVIRIALAGLLFVLKRDWIFVAITIFVLGLLIFGLVFEG